MRIRAAISPDPDDLFMFRAIIEGLVDTSGLEFTVETADTDALNRMASGDGADVNAISIAHYPRVAHAYVLSRHGASVGRGYGPVVVQLAGSPERPLPGLRIAVPGTTTTAYLVLRALAGEFEPVVVPIVPYARTFEALRRGEVDAALLIHEGRLTFADEGCAARLDIGEAWGARTGLPLPLGGNVIRRGLGRDTVELVDRVVRDSIAHALAHREAAMDWLAARGVALRDRERLDRYLAMYANADTLDMGDDGVRGVQAVLDTGAALGLFPPTRAEFARA
ncbi:MAG: ABC transporter substrate-binding protein [Deltaproteobacteria bacterium]|nr:ABC transporter substrate-binding protein [Deltaproteobacteria bacterium]